MDFPELWPSILRPRRITLDPSPMWEAGPVARSGQQAVMTDAGYWVLTLHDVPLRTADQIREWRGFVTRLRVDRAPVLIGPFDDQQAPAPPGLSLTIGGIPHSDGSGFSDGAGYAQSSIEITLAGALALRATSLTATIVQAGPLRRGHIFGIGDRLHMITSVPEVNGVAASFRFWPPTRADVEGDTALNFRDPRGRFVVATAATGRLTLEPGSRALPSIDLVEDARGL